MQSIGGTVITTTFETRTVAMPGQQEVRLTTIRGPDGGVLRVVLSLAWPVAPTWPLSASNVGIAPEVVGDVAIALQELAAAFTEQADANIHQQHYERTGP